MPHSVFNLYFNMVKTFTLEGLIRRRYMELLITVLDYVETPDSITYALKRTLASELLKAENIRMSKVIYEFLMCLILNIDVNFPSQDVIV